MGIKREKERQEAIRLRQLGKSYNEIRKTLGVRSKGTISYWLKNIRLTPVARMRLESNTKRAHERGFLKFNTDRTARIKDENQAELLKGKEQIGTLSARELRLVGAALYWGEGTKSLTRSNLSLSFVNSDAEMVRFFLRFVREILKVPDEKIRAGIHLYNGCTDAEGRRYWSKVTKLPEDRFWIIRQVSKASKGKRDPRLLPFGTVVVRVNDRKLFHKVLGMIKGLASET